MGSWDNTAYIGETRVDRVAAALDDVFGREGYVRVDKPAPRLPGRDDPMQTRGGSDNPLWGVAVIEGEGWTLIKTAPFELLSERAGGSLRLGALAVTLGAPAFQLNLYDGDSLLLVEASASGAIVVSGVPPAAGDSLTYQGVAIDPDRIAPRFSSIDVPQAVRDALAGTPTAAAFTVQSLLGFGAEWDGDEASAVDNRIQTNCLIPHEECAEGVALYYRRPAS